MTRAILPILRREYLARITTKGFWISTALLPLFTVGMALMPILTARSKTSTEPIQIVDPTGQFFPVVKQVISEMHDGTTLPVVTEAKLRPGETLDEAARRLNTAAESGEIQGYFLIRNSEMKDGSITFFARNPSSAVTGSSIDTVIAKAIRKYRLQKLGIRGRDVDAAIAPIAFEVKKATNDPKQKDQSGISAFVTSFGLVMFIYFSLIFYGVHVLRGVLEEKSNRIIEVIVSSVRPFDLMMGKIFGIGSVGLTQVLIWVTFAGLVTLPGVAGALSLSRDQLPAIDGAHLVFFPVFFVLGFFLYATIYAGIGSMFNSEEDAQQMVSVATMMLVVPMIAMMPVIRNPSGGLAVTLSLIPFFTPILMYLRIGVEMPPMWQIALSIAIMIVTIFFMIWLVAKIYRVGILMYGKKPTIPELLRWLRYT